MTGARIEFIVCIVAVISELLKNVLISERKGLVLYIDMALSTFFGWYLNYSFLPIRQKTILFFMPIFLIIHACET